MKKSEHSRAIIGRTINDSVPGMPDRPHPGEDAPNVNAWVNRPGPFS